MKGKEQLAWEQGVAGGCVWEVLRLRCLSAVSAKMSSWRLALRVWSSERGQV